MRKIDAHAHLIGDSPEALKLLEEHDMRVCNISVPDDQWEPWRTSEHPHYERLARTWPRHYAWCTSFDVPGPDDFKDPKGYAQRQCALLDQDFSRGAIALKLYYNIGEVVKKPDGSLLQMDDAIVEPILVHVEQKGWDVIWHFGGSEEARHRVLERHPKTRFVGAHMGTLPDCFIGDNAKLFERHPNFAADTSAAVRRFLKQDPKAVRDFFLKYQDRILFGTDLGAFEEMVSHPFTTLPPYRHAEYLQTLRTAYRTQFAYYETEGPVTVFEWGYFHGEGLHLPEPVLNKLYYSNAARWIPGLAH
jgi:hypothetical protein